ncbi:hypothetical protein IFR05_005169 [Cadophora sp. M221]|nr:hypothetical protein IFR05_005169 [Cadophora sp. M221]
MENYFEIERNDPKSKLKFSAVENISPNDCMKIILGLVTDAQTKYEVGAIKGPWGKVREAFRKLVRTRKPFTMGGILDHYRNSAAKRIGLSIVKQSRYGSDLSVKLQEIDNCSADIAESDTLIKLMAADTNIAARSTYAAEGNGSGKDEIRALVLELNNVVANVVRTHFTGFFNASPVLAQTTGTVASQGRLEEDGTAFIESRTGTPLNASVKGTSLMTKRLLLSLLNYGDMKPKADIKANLEHGLCLNTKQQNRVVYAVHKLQPLIGATSSSMLILNGFDNMTQGFHTPLSFVCGKLANALRDVRETSRGAQTKATCLSFFCGEHPRWQGNESWGL